MPGLALDWWLERTEECLGDNSNSNNNNNSGRRPLPASSLPRCVSPHLTSLHYVEPHMMYVLQYLTQTFHNDRRQKMNKR